MKKILKTNPLPYKKHPAADFLLATREEAAERMSDMPPMVSILPLHVSELLRAARKRAESRERRKIIPFAYPGAGPGPGGYGDPQNTIEIGDTMPRRKRRPAAKIGCRQIHLEDPGRNTDFRTMDLIDCLMHGDQCFATMLTGGPGFDNEEEEKRTWELNKDLLLGMMAENTNKDFRYLAGNRPWAWWKYESGLGKEIWSDFDRFSYGWQRWQYNWLKEHDLLLEGEEAKVRRLCTRILKQPRYDIDAPHLELCYTDGGEEERRRRREKRKPFELE